MTTDNWQQFKDIFQAALEMPQEKRSSYLKKACPDSASRAELEALLLCYENPAPNGKRSATASDPQSTDPTEPVPHDPLVESFIDQYHITEKLGEPTHRAQYTAVRLHDPALKKVVITIVKTSTPAGDFFSHFKKDRAMLMNLRHPNIASFLDSGITRHGAPYLITQHIEGTPIDEFCDANRLTIRARVELILNVCDAIQFAHDRFIAHGGISARNIIVTKAGIPMILDLGITGLLNDPCVQSNRKSEVQTELEYLSPEQIRGVPIAAADEVYSLGILFYRLLTGHSPYWVKAENEGELVPLIFEAIRPSKVIYQVAEQTDCYGKKITVTPERLSQCCDEKIRAIRKLLAGDVDSIVLKAIHKDPEKRYSSVEQFSRDLRRHLEGRTVSARKATLFYRGGKFFVRNQSGAIACLVAALALTVFATLSTLRFLIPIVR